MSSPPNRVRAPATRRAWRNFLGLEPQRHVPLPLPLPLGPCFLLLACGKSTPWQLLEGPAGGRALRAEPVCSLPLPWSWSFLLALAAPASKRFPESLQITATAPRSACVLSHQRRHLSLHATAKCPLSPLASPLARRVSPRYQPYRLTLSIW
jgi:hypothetical protein